jgi:hypothetical protein
VVTGAEDVSHGKCQNSGQGVVTEGMYPHISHNKASKCSHFLHSLLNLAVVSLLCVSFLCRVLSSDTSVFSPSFETVEGLCVTKTGADLTRGNANTLARIIIA